MNKPKRSPRSSSSPRLNPLASESEEIYHPESLPSRSQPFVMGELEIPRRLGPGTASAHYHGGVEISWIPRGDAQLYVEGTFYELRENDIFFVNPAVPHHTGLLSAETFHLGFVHISTEAILSIPPIPAGLAALQLFHAYSYDPGPVVRNRPDICAHLHSANEANISEAGHHMRIRAWGHIMMAISMLIDTVRASARTLPEPADQTTRVAVHRALEFISANFNRPIAVADIARSVNMSQSSLSHTFSETMNCSPIEYRNRIRLNFAMERLLSSDDKMEKIAEDCGFDSVTALHYLFKKATGRSPGQFRADPGI